MRVADYKQLRVYTLAFDSAMAIFELSRKWPAEERYSLTDQIRRSSRSVCTNLAEARRKRRYEAAFVSKLSDSDGEAAETEVHLEFALRCGYLVQESDAKFRDHYDPICRLSTMTNDAGSWFGADGELSEIPAEYVVRASGAPGGSEHESVRGSSAPNAPHASRSRRSTLQRPNAPRS